MDFKKRDKYKNSAERKSARQMRRRLSRKKKLKIAQATIHKKHHQSSVAVEALTVPVNFSIIDNFSQCMDFFERLRTFLSVGMTVKLDLRDIARATPDAILYLLSVLDELDDAMTGGKIVGNYPKNEDVKRLFVSSDFFRYCTSSKEHRSPDEADTLPIERIRGMQVDNSYVQRQYEFCMAHNVGKTKTALKHVNGVTLELMANTWKHASPSVGKVLWYSMATYQQTSGSVLMCFLDRGRGIPATMHRKPLEQLWPLDEYELLLDALSGKTYRSSTGQLWRGNGLPKVKQAFDRGSITNLVIMSGKAHVELSRKGGASLPKHFRGTLYTWEIPARTYETIQ